MKNNFANERSKYIEMLNTQIVGISNILNIKGLHELVSFESQNNIRLIMKSAERLKRKLETNEFEIAIVGLEKAGKSTFANALMSNNLLPTKDERCTYTSTSIRYGNIDEAIVEFFSYDEFNTSFKEKLAGLGSVSDNTPDFELWDTAKLDGVLSKASTLSSELKNLSKDIYAMIENRASIMSLLGTGKCVYGVDEFDKTVKEFIEDPSKAVAVKEIVIKSTKFSEMKNAVMYDVPGFDSPTQMHKDQTLSKMKQADVIILVINADKPSFNDSLVNFFDSVEYDDDGIKISDKTFVFANRADCASTLNANKEKIISELIDYEIMNKTRISERLIFGSAKARLDLDNNLKESPAISGINKNKITDGISEMRTSLETYNNKEQFDILTKKVLLFAELIHSTLDEVKIQNTVSDFAANSIEFEKNKIKSSAPYSIQEQMGALRAEIQQSSSKNTSITNKVRSNIISKICGDNYAVTDDDISKARNLTRAGVEIVGKIDADIRDKKFTEIYNDFIEGVVNLAVDEHEEVDSKMKKAFMVGLEITEDNHCYNELARNVEEYIKCSVKAISPSGYYSSLIRRYSRDLFEILIGTPFATAERFTRFEEHKNNFYSLSIFDTNYDASVLPGQQPMHYQILFHKPPADEVGDLLENAIVLVENILCQVILINDKLFSIINRFVEKYNQDSLPRLKRILSAFNYEEKYDEFETTLYPQNNAVREAVYKLIELDVETDLADITIAKPAEISNSEYRNFFVDYDKNIEGIKNEFGDDIKILHDILDNQVMKAVSIEIPFIDLIKQEISDIIESTRSPAFLNFIDANEALLLSEKSEQLLRDKEKRERQQLILNEISSILKSIPKILV